MLVGVYDCSGREIPAAVRGRGGAVESPGPASGPRLVVGRQGAHWLLDGGLACALEGRVDNLRDVGEALEVHATDPGPILGKAWRRWGESMLDRLRGSFVLTVWDASQRQGMIAVDQLGTRSVYYRAQGIDLLFASEMAELLGLLDRRPDPDPVHLSHWLAFTDPPPASTLYTGVRHLPGGHFLRLADRRWDVRSYWPGRRAQTSTSSREEAVAGLRARLEQSVERAMAGAADTAGVLLSGGLDSTTVASLAARRDGQARVRSYSATFPQHASADETELIGQLADTYGLSWSPLAVARGSAVGGSIEFLEHVQLPPSSPNLFFWVPLLRRAAAEGIVVMLDGEGGDELFGAARYLPADRLRRGRVLAARRLIMRLPGAGAGPSRRQVVRVAGEYAVRGALPAPLRRLMAQTGWGRADTPFWLNRDTAELHRATLDPDRWMAAAGPRWRAWLLHVLRDSTGGPQLAREHVRQRTTMAGLAPRHPLLDVDVVEFMLAVDPELSFDPHLDRPLLREAMAGALPDTIRLRPRKSNFDAPFHQSLTRELPAVSALLGDPSSELRAYVDLDVVRREVLERAGERFSLGGHAWSLNVWRLVTAELWLRLLGDPLAPRRVLERCGFPASSLESTDVPMAC